MKIFSLAFIALVLSFTMASAQFRNDYNLKPQPRQQQGNSSSRELPKFYFGGGGGLGFGTGYNYYSLFPIAGYRVTDAFSVGTGFTYQRYNYTQPYSYSFTQYGLTPFLRYNFNPLFVQT